MTHEKQIPTRDEYETIASEKTEEVRTWDLVHQTLQWAQMHFEEAIELIPPDLNDGYLMSIQKLSELVEEIVELADSNSADASNWDSHLYKNHVLQLADEPGESGQS